MKFKKLPIKLSQLQVGDIVLQRDEISIEPTTWLSALIRGFIGTPFNHCKIVWKDNDKLYLAEALADGVEVYMTPEEALLNRELKIIRLNLFNPLLGFDERIINERVLSCKDVKYDYANLFLHQPVLHITEWLFEKMETWIGRTKYKAIKRMECAEFVAYCLQESYPEWWSASPDIFYNEKRKIDIYQGYCNQII
jgi:hypothetical protein